MSHRVRILDAGWTTHNVRRLAVEKPEGYAFRPGEATEVAVDKDGWREEKRPFTFTSLRTWDHLESNIKVYPEHDGVTEQIGRLEPGDHLFIDEPWGAIAYRGAGTYIAGGAGITPFIAILRDVASRGKDSGNTLIFSNATENDIILREEFEKMEGLACIFTVTGQPDSDLARGPVDRAFLERTVSDFSQPFYVCGPPGMVKDIAAVLRDLGAKPDGIVFEE